MPFNPNSSDSISATLSTITEDLTLQVCSKNSANHEDQETTDGMKLESE